MIDKMKYVCIVVPANSKRRMLGEIRDLGVLHVKEKKKAASDVSKRFADLSQTYQTLKMMDMSSEARPVLGDDEFSALDSKVCKALAQKKECEAQRGRATLAADKLRAWGDFNPSELKELSSCGVDVFFYRMGKKELLTLQNDDSVRFVKLSSVDKMETIAVIGKPLDSSFPATRFELPEKGLSELESEIYKIDEQLRIAEDVLTDACQELASYKVQIVRCVNDVNYSSVNETAQEGEGLVWLAGYIPADCEDSFRKAACKNSWGYLISDPDDDDDQVPTKVKYTKLTKIIEPVFELLGTVPGYKEYDISFWFLLFFSLFFAMIIGDAGYGIIFLILAIVMLVKQKKASNLILLIFVVSFTTIFWGAITGTWFGLESAMDVPFLRALVIKPLANYPELFGLTATDQQNSMMKLCFMIGTIQLTLACVMNIRRKIAGKDLSWVADLGWLMSINALYYVVLLLVIGADASLGICAAFIITGFLLVCLFGGMSPDKTFAQGLKSGLADAFTNFLNTISAFGNIMSYIRLFAVGLASLAIAQSFNDMALGFNGFLKVAGIFIFVIGHALNLVMGLLSVIVHGVRLNLLEFSGQLGMEWTGVAYEPFKVSTK